VHLSGTSVISTLKSHCYLRFSDTFLGIGCCYFEQTIIELPNPVLFVFEKKVSSLDHIFDSDRLDAFQKSVVDQIHVF